ncbi:alpha/beta fold hydrolase [Aeromicrobium chenweiae]|uniref:Alpha/beta hydrolase n=1 Tax=Aeromicrobium chenweiae TaxID=2079793 RepID=A0A2S0WHU1_9ACTN|nr:alpha/beta hydrolase [Aeromicrobium chenweiae]AWB90916.1 alpha/beta hydrolase [Aeromicrobium chenweiae]TGN32135.1 alpha/beta hydrolase [Aeromicrobium chenweiae]
MKTSRKARNVTIAAVAAVAAVGIVGVNSAQAEPKHPAPSAKPTIVLEHGAWADASSWNGVVKRLSHDGYDVVAAPNPLRGLPQDVASLRGLLSTIKGPVILAGHSYGGDVITEAATGNKNVKGLVYIAGFAPDAGESISSLLEKPLTHPTPPLPVVPVAITNPDGTQSTEIYLDRKGFRAAFAGDVPKGTADLMAATQRATDASALTGKISTPAWRSIPSWYLVGTQDQAIAPELQRFMAKRMHATTVEIKASHASLVSHPSAVTDLIERAARTVR